MRDNCGWPDDHKVFAKATPPTTGSTSLPFPPLKEYLDLGSVGLLRLGPQGAVLEVVRTGFCLPVKVEWCDP